MKRNSLSLFLVGAFLSSLTFFAQAHGRPQLTRQSGTRRLLQESSAPWLQEDFPSPEKDRRACGASSSRRLCDPDGILSSSGKQNLEEYLATKKHIGMTKNECLDSKASDKLEDGGDSETEKIELQMGVALVKNMDLSPFSTSSEEDREDRAAETFARYIHDSWGVGVGTECGGAGVLLFLSIEDRAVYVSRGAALEDTLTDRRLDRAIENMKSLLRSEEYDNAILQALEDIRRYIEEGPPTLWENFWHIFVHLLFPLVWIGTVLGTLLPRMWANSRMQRDYARVRSQLSEIDRSRAEALQGKYKCTSCPICLEDFEKPAADDAVVTTGSDGQPIKLLRCGHAMDDSCWEAWVSNGQGTFNKCPICNQDVGETGNNNSIQRHQDVAVRRRAANENNNPGNIIGNADNNDNRFNNDEDRMIRQYRRERQFRLARLGARYPQIVRPAQIERWSQPNYDGTIVRDPSFVQSNPSLTSSAPRTGGRSMGGGGFGGSSSGGGRGGRW